MSSRLKINSARLVELRKSPRQLQILTAYGTLLRDAANADFKETASARDRHSQENFARSPTPYDLTAVTGRDRVRVFIQTASLAARRHEHSSRGSSLLRAIARNNG
jgi:hypothetical protein